MHVKIERPDIRPDPAITHKLRLDKHQSDASLRKTSARSRFNNNEDRQSTKNSVHYRNHLEESERSSPQRIVDELNN